MASYEANERNGSWIGRESKWNGASEEMAWPCAPCLRPVAQMCARARCLAAQASALHACLCAMRALARALPARMQHAAAWCRSTWVLPDLRIFSLFSGFLACLDFQNCYNASFVIILSFEWPPTRIRAPTILRIEFKQLIRIEYSNRKIRMKVNSIKGKLHEDTSMQIMVIMHCNYI